MGEDQAFAALGRALLGSTFGSTKLTDGEAANAGRAWFKSVLPTIRARVCGNATLDRLLLSDAAAARNSALIAAVEAALTGAFHGIPVATIANAVVVYGVHVICKGKA